MREIKNRIIEARKKRNVTQHQLAKMINISRSTVAGYELGYIKKVRADVYDDIARCLNVSTDWLEGYSDDIGEYEWI